MLILIRWQWLMLFFFVSCSVAKQHDNISTLYGNDLKPLGRYSLNSNNDLNLVSSAAHFGFTFTGKTCELFTYIKGAGGHNYLQYEMDGVYQKKIKITGDSVQAITLYAATEGRHTVEMYKTTEAQTGPIYIRKITAHNLHVVNISKAPMIEFIGNSITCGAASDTSEVACGRGLYHDQHNAYYSYGPRVARALHLNYILSCVSGIGMYRNWNSDGPTLPEVYEKTDLSYDSTQLWNFSTYSPAIVSIALGTNDMSRGNGVKKRLPFDSAQFVSRYIDFVKLVKVKYPKARIALLGSPMMHGSDKDLLEHCLTAVQQSVDGTYPSSQPVAVYFFDPIKTGGCNGHPSVEDHGKMAAQLIPFFKKLL